MTSVSSSIFCSLLSVSLMFVGQGQSTCPSVECKCTDSYIDCAGTWNWMLKKVPPFYYENITYDTLDLSENKIRKFKYRSFDGLQVKEIIVNRNLYSNVVIEPKAFRGLENYLEGVEFQQSKLVHLPNGLFRNFVKLKDVNFSDNRLESLGIGVFKGCESLLSVVARNNLIEKLDSTSMSGLRSLTKIDLAHNSIRTIDAKTFSGLRKLEELSLAENTIRDLQPKTFKVDDTCSVE